MAHAQAEFERQLDCAAQVAQVACARADVREQQARGRAGRCDPVPAGGRGCREFVAFRIADQVEEDVGIAVAGAGLVAGEGLAVVGRQHRVVAGGEPGSSGEPVIDRVGAAADRLFDDIGVLLVAVGLQQMQVVAPADVEAAIGLDRAAADLDWLATEAQAVEQVGPTVDVVRRLVAGQRAQQVQVVRRVERELVQAAALEEGRRQRIERRRRWRREAELRWRQLWQPFDIDLKVADQVVDARVVEDDRPAAATAAIDLDATQADRRAAVWPVDQVVERGHDPVLQRCRQRHGRRDG